MINLSSERIFSKGAEAIDLEQAADELLAQHGYLGDGSGIYSETQIERKIRDEDKRLPRLEEVGVCEETADALLDRAMEELIEVAGLTALQEIIYRLYISGLGCRRMAAVLGIRVSMVQRRLRTVKRKVKAAYEEGIYAGWYEVYLSEVDRPAYRRRK